MRTFKRILALLPAMVLWAFISVILWNFVFIRITDTSPAAKITLYVDAAVPGDRALAVEMEKALQGKTKMVKVHPFSYALFGSADIRSADLYIIRASQTDNYRDWLVPLPQAMRGEEELMSIDGEPFGIPVFLPGENIAAAGTYISYEDNPEEACYLFFGASSLHVPGNEGAVDSAALDAAKALLVMP